MPTFFLSVFKMPKWGFARINRFRSGFLWKGKDHENIRGGHCLVNWATCIRPKSLGGLGIKDREKFSRALRLRWLWHKWDHIEKPWKNLLKNSDQADKQLFFCSTEVRVGNGRNTPFWESKWLNEIAPKDLAPNLFHKARSKKRSVHQELQNLNWARNLTGVDNSTELEEFVMLFMALEHIQLNQQNDGIRWRWMADGKFSVSSAYDCQFRGSISQFPATPVWKAQVEPKCRFFAWLVLHGKILTVDNMLKRNWDCDHSAPSTCA
jgi:hypothetical protein